MNEQDMIITLDEEGKRRRTIKELKIEYLKPEELKIKGAMNCEISQIKVERY